MFSSARYTSLPVRYKTIQNNRQNYSFIYMYLGIFIQILSKVCKRLGYIFIIVLCIRSGFMKMTKQVRNTSPEVNHIVYKLNEVHTQHWLLCCDSTMYDMSNVTSCVTLGTSRLSNKYDFTRLPTLLQNRLKVIHETHELRHLFSFIIRSPGL
jgi:hypothetical protein